MILRKKEYPRRRIKQSKMKWHSAWLRAERGQIKWLTALFLILFLAIVLSIQLQIRAFQASSLYLEDALATSNLASAVIDLQEYGISHTIRVADPEAAYERYCAALRENLQLDAQWEGRNSALLSGRIQVENYTVYNVQGDEVTVFFRGSDGAMQVRQEEVGVCRAPNGIPVESTGIYSEISFPVEGAFGMRVRAHKGKLVDIVKNE